MFRGILLSQNNGTTRAELKSLAPLTLANGELEIDVAYSTLNYKDALAIGGKNQVVKSWPMVPGIDCVGTVRRSQDANWKSDDQVVVTGWGLGETTWGGLAERCRIKAEWALKPPKSFAPRTCMIIGTAGVTAALCTMALIDHGCVVPGSRILVTGAAGGVGSIAVALLAQLGCEVVAATGRVQEGPYLKSLGAAEIVDRRSLDRKSRPLETEQWHAVVDTVGGRILAHACASTRWNGAVAACGLASSSDFPTTVMPFILRGVTLYGINSVYVDNGKRARAWKLLADHLDEATLGSIAHDISLDDAIAYCPEVLDGRARGRTVVAVRA